MRGRNRAGEGSELVWIRVDQIRPYARNPRRSANPAYGVIKESIRVQAAKMHRHPRVRVVAAGALDSIDQDIEAGVDVEVPGSPVARRLEAQHGVLVDAGHMAKEIGFRFQTAITTAAGSDCVAWTDGDSERQVHQDRSGRLFDVLQMAHHAIRSSRKPGDGLTFELYRVPRDGRSTEAKITSLKLIVGPGDNGEFVITILSDED